MQGENLAFRARTAVKSGRFMIKVRELFVDKTVSLNEKWYEDARLPENNFKAGVERINRCVDEWILSLGYQHDREKSVYNAVRPSQEKIALFAHEGFGMVFLSSLLDIPYPLFCTCFCIGHSELTIISFNEKDGVAIPVILTHANDGHLYKEGLLKIHSHKIRALV